MPMPTHPVTVVADWPGLSQDPRSNLNQQPGSAAEQTNCACLIQGALDVRRGVREVSFESE